MDIKIVNPIPQDDIDTILKHLSLEFHDLEFIGSGCQGTVYKYKDYAIKWCEGHRDGKILQLFQDNPLFLKLYFYNDDIMVTEYLDAINAYGYYDKNVELDINANYIFDYCHSKGYIPYDIHDENIIVTNDDRLKIIDVGGFLTLSNHMLSTDREFEELDNIITHVKRPKIVI